VPRLAVGVYATSASTPLYFAQAIGRFVRARADPVRRRACSCRRCPCCWILPLSWNYSAIHVIGKPHREKDSLDDELLIDANKQKDEPGEDEKPFVALAADAELDQVIYDGSSFGTATIAGSAEEADYLGIPGLLDADQMRALLRETSVPARSPNVARPRDPGARASRWPAPRNASPPPTVSVSYVAS